MVLATLAAFGGDGQKPYPVAIWLVPAGGQERQLREVISGLAAKYSGRLHYVPVFSPHATLCVGELKNENVGSGLRALFGQVDDFADQQPEFSLAVQRIDHRSKWSQFLFLKLDKDGAPPAMVESGKAQASFPALAGCTVSTDADPPKQTMLHVSLMYNTDEENSGAILKDVASQDFPGEIVFESIQVVVPRSGNWEDILKKQPGTGWDVIYARKLKLPKPPLRMVMAGGQTGVDQAAWRAARLNRILTGGWCPPDHYLGRGQWVSPGYSCEQTREDASADAQDIPRSQRTEWNVRDSDATLILRGLKQRCLAPQQWSDLPLDVQEEVEKDRGTKLTIDAALHDKKHPMICDPGNSENVAQVVAWIKQHNVRTLNVGGPSEATEQGVGTRAESFLLKVFAQLRKDAE